MKALILGSYINADKSSFILTKSASAVDEKLSNAITERMKLLGPLDQGKGRLLLGLSSEYCAISIVGLGRKDAGVNVEEQVDERRENVRAAVGIGYKSILSSLNKKVNAVEVDDCDDPQSAAEGAYLARYYFDDLKSEKHWFPEVSLLESQAGVDARVKDDWQTGVFLAEAQNELRRLGDMPANHLTPLLFIDEAKRICSKLPIELIAHDRKWAEQKGMGSFLSVTQGSDNPCAFLVLRYRSNDLPDSVKPICLVGKGVCFDTGGICLKPSLEMYKMKGDMLGAGNVLCAIAAIAKLKIRAHVIGLMPLTENTINGKAAKPGDVFRAMNGKTIEVRNTDAEGRMILADALCYANEFEPSAVIDIATLTGDARIGVGDFCTVAFCTKDEMWKTILDASIDTGERFWRYPLFTHCDGSVTADLDNVGDKGPGTQYAAAFLKNFTKCENWTHLDVAVRLAVPHDSPMFTKDLMTGKPMRTLVQIVKRYFESATSQ